MENIWRLGNFEDVWIFLLIILFLIIFSLYIIVNHFVKQQNSFLNQLSDVTPSQLKSPLGRLQRYSLINNLKIMKKYIGVSILLLVVVILTMSTVVVLDSRTYFKQYFEIQRTKLNLRSEKSVDSIQNIVIIKNSQIDSLIKDNAKISYENYSLRKNETETRMMIKSFQKLVNKK